MSAVSPTNFGWMSVWMMDDEVDDGVGADHRQHHAGSAFEQPEQGRRNQAKPEADVRDVVGDERQQAPQDRQRDAHQLQRPGVEDRDDQTEHRRHHQIIPGTGGERGERRGDIGPHPLQDLEPAVIADRVHRHE